VGRKLCLLIIIIIISVIALAQGEVTSTLGESHPIPSGQKVCSFESSSFQDPFSFAMKGISHDEEESSLGMHCWEQHPLGMQ
jgi:ABC-type molybdate transport system substrate-binding protein